VRVLAPRPASGALFGAFDHALDDIEPFANVARSDIDKIVVVERLGDARDVLAIVRSDRGDAGWNERSAERQAKNPENMPSVHR
jgi:hypothetical protein